MGLQRTNDAPAERSRPSGVFDQILSVTSASALRAELEDLLSQRQYDEALALLCSARWEGPQAAELARAIEALKDKLLEQYLHRLGDLDAVPQSVSFRADTALDEEERALLFL